MGVTLEVAYYGLTALSCWKIFGYFRRSFFDDLEPAEAWRRQAVAIVALLVAAALIAWSLRAGLVAEQWLVGMLLSLGALGAFAVVSVAGLFLFTRIGIEG